MNTVDHTILKNCIVAVELRHTHTATASFNRIGEKNASFDKINKCVNVV